jgi:molecular chaperone HtpG
MNMDKGTLQVNTQDIFPIIKKFLYTDQEIFLRELISNAIDAMQKVKLIASKGELKDELGDLRVYVDLNKKKRILKISDHGIGMTKEEIDKYINQIAFSSAEEFIKKYENIENKEKSSIIGHFGLGFYSSFMVADKVEIISKSYQENSESVKWTCEGSTDFEFSKGDREERGTDIILHIAKDASEYLEESRIYALLNKYCRYLPYEIEFGTEKVWETKEDEKDKDGNPKQVEVEKPRIINNTNPLWIRKPSEIKEEEYRDFYNELYPLSQPPLFWIHLNVDYPFHLTGILYFPKISKHLDVQKNKIKLFSNQVYVTDSVEDIVPEFLTLLHGVIDSPDIPLNVSRSSLQSDSNVKKISSYIVRKVADRLSELFKKDRKAYEEKWNDISIFVKYGMLSDDKFYDKSKSFFLLRDIDDTYYTMDEYKDFLGDNQKDKDGNTIWLFSSDKDEQIVYIDSARKRVYNVLYFNDLLDSHWIQMLEQKLEKTQIKRIDAAAFDDLINKGEKKESVLNKEQEEKYIELFKKAIKDDKTLVKTEAMSPEDPPVIIVEEEFGRRMKEMSRYSSWGASFGDMPDMFQVILNSNHKIVKSILDLPEEEKQNAMILQLYDLARLSKNILKGKDLSGFINRSFQLIQ